ncbi:TIGR04222 domain-containing membrane protein [Streptomyces sp. TX20-6-3]|uniref:TIGR04222 domain-containing membrane protein n=1 Tax=Streptomyces sp. TX20-6-3 TaxID=3028705 RepID=UPI0029B833AA|nr:TIGR04222 domain-containing membrane protein [Streptomyces sp. TX20-6-3]MDX2564559.1 TIGR04222 domain-containing membrane protein [Streptomyces sp. TX20-6-3]
MVWVPLLLVACVVAGVGCARLCRATLAAAPPPRAEAPEGNAPELTVGEAAYLAGGPLRVTDLTLVSMHRERRLLLARTGWVTVLDAGACAADPLERAVIGALGPQGQAPVPAVRPQVAAADSVHLLAERLVARGLAVSAAGRREVATGLRAVRAGFLLSLALGTVSALLGPAAERAAVLAGFALPLLASGLCLLIGRTEVYPYTRWASPAGQRLLAGLSPADPLTALATRGPAVLEPELRAALRGGG